MSFVWSPEEDAILVELYLGSRPVKHQMHRLPGRSYPGAKARARKLDLDPKPPIVDGSLSVIKAAATRELEKGIPLSEAGLHKILGASRAGIKPVLRSWHRNGIRIAGWEKVGLHGWLPKWLLGDEPDVPKPAPKSKSQSCRDWRQRNRIAKGIYNPFAAAAGLVSAPTGAMGRVYIHLTDSNDELEAA